MTVFRLVHLTEIHSDFRADICKYILPEGKPSVVKSAFYSPSHESLRIQLGSILLPVLYAACVMSPMFSGYTKKRRAP